MKNTPNIIKAFFLIFLNFFTLIIYIPHFSQSAMATGNTYSVTVSSDKTNVKPGDSFSIIIDVKNTSSNVINNLEIRVPFARTIKDSTYQVESPSFNKILDTIEYPTGFNSRAWIINSLDPNESKSFSLKYQVIADPQIPGGLVSSFNLPISWVDPAGAQSNTQLDVKTFRADIYINKIYSNSFTLNLPKLESLDNQVALVNFNAKYLFAGSKTTNPKSITNSNINSFPNFTLDSSEMTIEWLAPIDFSAPSTFSQLANLDASLATSWGKIAFNATNLPFLANKPVRISFKDQNFVNPPKIKLGENVTGLAEAKATFSQSNKTIVIEQPSLNNVAIVPNIEIDNPVIETNVEDVEIVGKVSDPNSPVTYSIDNSPPQTITGIDLSTGKFTIRVNIKNGTKQVEIKSSFKNKEEESKIVIIKFIEEATTTQATTTEPPSTISLPLNQITIALLLAAVGLLAIIVGIIYYLVKKRRTNNPKSAQINLNPVVNKVSSIGTNDEQINTSNQKEKIDLTQLKKKYEIDDSPSPDNIAGKGKSPV